MNRRQFLIKMSHWYERTTRFISLDTLTSLGLVPGVHVPAQWLKWAERIEAVAQDEADTLADARYAGCQ